MSESGGMSVNCLTAGDQTVATDVKGNITTLPANLRPAGATTALNLTWDSDNKLRSADIDANGTADVNFQYDALGRRVARSGTGGSVVYVQMEQQTIADYPVGGAATTPTFRYVYASYIDEPVVRKTAGTGGTLVYFHRNHQYSVTAVTTSTGAIAERYAYTAYGQPTILNASGLPLTPQSSTLSNRYTYTGREWDATLGLHHFRARWMSPIAGRFLGRDPIGYEAGVSVYQFLRSRILVRLDPTGTVDINCHCSCIQQGHGGRVDDSFETDVTVNCLTLPTICCSRACEIERRNRYGDPPIRGCDKSSCTFTWQWGPPLPPVKPEHCSIPDCIGGCSLAAASAIFLCQRAGLPGFICQNAGRSAAVACAMRCFWRCDDPCSWIAPNLIPCVPINPNTPR